MSGSVFLVLWLHNITIKFYRQQKALAATSTRCAAFRAKFGRSVSLEARLEYGVIKTLTSYSKIGLKSLCFYVTLEALALPLMLACSRTKPASFK